MLGGNALLALGAAAVWGVGDFSGGMGVKTAGGSLRAALRFILASHATSFVLLVALAFPLGGPLPHGAPVLWGLTAGVTGGLAILAFYSALARGAMGSAAAMSGLLAAAIPALVSAAVEGVPGWRHALGFAVAGVAIWAIGGGSRQPGERTAALLAIAGGAGFGLYFVALRFSSPAGLIWPMATARIGSLATCGFLLLALGKGQQAAETRPLLRWVLLTALFDTCGNLLFIAATRTGRLDSAAVLASLYPASTILLAAAILKEKPTRRQGLGMLTALLAVVLVTL